MKQRRKLHRELMSMRLFRSFLDDFAAFGSIVFFLIFIVITFFIGEERLSLRLFYCLVISLIVVLTIKSVHFKERPQAEEFGIFMERVVASSFPSTHSLNATILSALLTITFPYLWVIVLSWTLAIFVYLHRYLTKKHFIIDIIGGILIGLAEVILVVRLF